MAAEHDLIRSRPIRICLRTGFSRAAVTAALILLTAVPSIGAEQGVWWEAEDPDETNFPAATPFSAETFEATRHEILSGGDWLTNAGPRKGPEAFARWRVAVPETGEYTLWARKFYKHGPFRWRFDAGDWRHCGRDIGLLDLVSIRTHLGANWVYLGREKLAKGKRTFELRLTAKPGEKLTACFDCFYLTRGTFLPRGRLKPGERTKNAEPGWWPIDPDADPFGEALLDLSHLNDARAGDRGFVTRRGEDLVVGGKNPIRFWGVNCGPGVVNQGKEPVRYLARRLARAGVNCVRFHGRIRDGPFLERLHFFIAAMADEGIYTKLSFYFPVWHERKPFALLFFDRSFQEEWRGWARSLLDTVSPHTGKRLADDPAVAIVEIVNEDSLFFWTFKPGQTIPFDRMAILEKRFGDWLAKRYGSIGKAVRAWDGESLDRDEPSAGRMGLYEIWHLTERGAGRGGHRKRASDQLRFLVETQRGFYAETVKWLREELGVKCAISASNWKTADRKTLGALERYTYTAADVIDRHGYFGGRHEGDGSSYSVRVGHEFRDRAGVREIGATPVPGVSTRGFPEIVSEIGWTNPNRFRAEFPVLAAAVGAQTGVDGWFFFAIGSMGWASAPAKFPVNVPTVLGQFPGCALIYRTGVMPEGPAAHLETLDLERLYEFEGTRYANLPNLDALRRTGRERDDGGRLPFLEGRVVQAFDGKPAGKVSKAKPWMVWDHGKGVFLMNRPRAQVATGFLRAAAPIRMASFDVESGNEYGTVLVAALDGRPIDSSKRVLVQAVTEEKPFGWRTKDGRIESLGGYPMMVREVDAVLRFRRRFRKATVLDVHGYAVRETPVTNVLRLPRGALYTIVE